ncbi:MAG: molybdopterin dinucleotide binding domain-containing protein [Acidimicrobiales bacterium]
MHNVEVLVKGKPRCTLHVHPDDAALGRGRRRHRHRHRSRAGSLDAPVEVTDAVRPGVVSLPHGWGHDGDGVRLGWRAATPASTPTWWPTTSSVDELFSGNAVLNGIPVTVAPAG